MMKSDGSEGTERKAGREDDVQRTCHFSMKSRSMRLSLHIVKSGKQNLGKSGGSKNVGKSRVFENEKPRLLPGFSPIISHLQKVGRTWEESGKKNKKNKTKGDFNEEDQLSGNMWYPMEQSHQEQEVPDNMFSRHLQRHFFHDLRKVMKLTAQQTGAD